jgi:hypothetical protein
MSDPSSPAGGNGEWLVLANEFAEVRVRKVHTRNGVRLEIVAPKLERAILLDPVELESLTWQTPEVFSSFLVTPFGPEPDVE